MNEKKENIKFISGGIVAPKGFLASGVHCGLRKSKTKKDLALIFSEVECNAAAVYTTNKVAGAPIAVTKEHLKNGTARAVICNSGIANTCNPDGIEIANAMSKITADMLGIKESEVIIASTGVIGTRLPLEPIQNGLPELKKQLGNSDECGENAAIAIMTTDTRKKEFALEFEIEDGKKTRIGLIAKGSGMIEPNMATMLSFVTTDINISTEMLQAALSAVIADTFNMVSIDGDTSTNDMVSVMASGLCGNTQITEKDKRYDIFKQALYDICEKAARYIAFDGEGATKLIECKIYNADSKLSARKLSKSVINSSLVKTTIFGADANWGRVLCALGYSGIEFDPNNVDVWFQSSSGKIKVCECGGSVSVEVDEDFAKEILSQEIVEILIDMKSGTENAVAWGCDLSYEYVRINGDYRS